MQITYENGGPSYQVNEYFPHLHYKAAATLANQNYDQLIKWGNEYDSLQEADPSSEPLEKLAARGANSDIGDLDIF
ncbi:hypothetical protein EGH24_06080 [Halonotius terrestris]|uniref:Uncharacterized protein n=1 Tax=Halonotius terrestris TaxID=2487750 RepID=A0A8J8TDA2_9EURY|nr:hypothetical protein [Halonotius terrestris]TQQ82999.1 hypothetical protein EGH24_06080 [Halonotius terrestris]